MVSPPVLPVSSHQPSHLDLLQNRQVSKGYKYKNIIFNMLEEKQTNRREIAKEKAQESETHSFPHSGIP